MVDDQPISEESLFYVVGAGWKQPVAEKENALFVKS